MSVINHKHRHIFVHVPKCAGTAMERRSFVGGSGHCVANALIPLAREYWSWGFVRNPYDRALSVYSAYSQHCQRGSGSHLADPFSSVLLSIAELRRGGAASYLRWHFQPQWQFLCWPKTQEIAVDFVGRFEQLDEHWCIVCDKIGHFEALPHVNSSAHDSWRAVYTPDMVELVNEIYDDDFRLFGYDKELKRS